MMCQSTHSITRLCTMNRAIKTHPLLIRTFRRSQSTQAHIIDVPELPHLNKYKESGIPGLLSSKGLQNGYFNRISSHVTKLNQALISSSITGTSDLDVLIDENSKASNRIQIFNNASLIKNISFAMKSIGEIRDDVKEIPISNKNSIFNTPDISTPIVNQPTDSRLLNHINEDFGSLIEFKTLLLASANSINGDGFTWLVARDSNRFREEIRRPDPAEIFDNLFILNTYNAGSPKNNTKVDQLSDLKIKLEKLDQHHKDQLSTSTIPTFEQAESVVQFENIGYRPLLAIDVSPKMWLLDYGVYGKRAYLEQVWKSIDWEIVSQRLPENKVSVLPKIDH